MAISICLILQYLLKLHVLSLVRQCDVFWQIFHIFTKSYYFGQMEHRLHLLSGQFWLWQQMVEGVSKRKWHHFKLPEIVIFVQCLLKLDVFSYCFRKKFSFRPNLTWVVYNSKVIVCAVFLLAFVKHTATKSVADPGFPSGAGGANSRHS